MEWARDTLVIGRGRPHHTAFAPVKVGFGGSLARGCGGSGGDPENFLSCSPALSDQALLYPAVPPPCLCGGSGREVVTTPRPMTRGRPGSRRGSRVQLLVWGQSSQPPNTPAPATASHGPALCRAGALAGQTRVQATVRETGWGRELGQGEEREGWAFGQGHGGGVCSETHRVGWKRTGCCGLCLGDPSGLGEPAERTGVTLMRSLWLAGPCFSAAPGWGAGSRL